MATANRNTDTNPDDYNDLFDYGGGLDDILKEAEQNTRNEYNASINNNSNNDKDKDNRNGTNPSDDLLGIDEAIKTTKKRAPIAKLDETRLLSQAGIPKLRKTAKTKLRLKGKGHEFSDAARILNFYQLWLDDLYPRAKFADGLAIIEKLGHTKRLQVMRREWIEEGKPKSSTYDDTLDLPTRLEDPISRTNNDNNNNDNNGNDNIFEAMEIDQEQQRPRDQVSSNNGINSIFGGGPGGTRGVGTNSFPDDEDLFVSDNEDAGRGMGVKDTSSNAKQAGDVGGVNNDDDDDLDALLAEEEERVNRFTGKGAEKNDQPQTQTQTKAQTPPINDAYEDDWAALDDL